MEMGMEPNVSRSTGFLNFYIFFDDHFLGHIAGAVFHIPLWSSSLSFCSSLIFNVILF